MHIKPLVDLGHNLTVLSDEQPVDVEYVKNIHFIALPERKIRFRAIFIALRQLLKLAYHGKFFRVKELRRLKSLFNMSLQYIDQLNEPFFREFDIVHCHFLTRPICIATFSSKIEKPLVITIHGSDIYKSPSNSISDLDYIETAFRKSAQIMVPGTSELRAVSLLKCSMNKVKILPWGVDTSFFTPPISKKEQQQLKNKWAVNDRKILLSVRNLKPLYNIKSIIRALSSLPNIHELMLVIAGNGSEKQELKELCCLLKVNNSVKFIGNVSHDDLLELYQLSDVYVQNPTSDALPYSLLEALSCGLPSIFGKIGSIGDLVESAHKRHIFDLFYSTEGIASDEVLAVLMNKALSQSKKRFRNDLALREFVNQEYSLSIHTKKIENIYKQLIEK